MSDIEMPEDWNDTQGWENYYAALDEDEFQSCGSFSPSKLVPFVEQLMAKGWKTAWVPGCGVSRLPRLLSQLGMNVHATDISPTAIAYQNSEESKEDISAFTKQPPSEGAYTCQVHDFREPYQEDYFDIIFNIKAFQGFGPETMRQVATTHYKALMPGRHAYFDTMNVQGERRDILEASLVEAGFVLPFYELHRWYRQRLQQTNIPHIFILGRPMVPLSDEYSHDKKRWERDKEILHGITEEFERKAQAEQENEKQRRTETDRTAVVIYSTG